MRACVLIRKTPEYRREAFAAGLRRCGYEVVGVPDASADLLLSWNRYGTADKLAERFEAQKRPVLICENGYLGRSFNGGQWYALARGHHNGAGETPNVPRGTLELAPWRREGKEIVVLAQRGIGEPGVAQPPGWSTRIASELRLRTGRPIRIREHPGEKKVAVPLEADLANAWACVTWGSGAALKSICMGIPVFYGFPRWIGALAAKPVGGPLEPFYGDRGPMLQRLMQSMWTVEEIASGEPFRLLLSPAGEREGVARL